MTSFGIIEPNYFLRTTFTEFLSSFAKVDILFSSPEIKELKENSLSALFCPPDVLLFGSDLSTMEIIYSDLQYLKAKMPGTKVLLMTSCTSPAMAANFLRAGADGHMVRPSRVKDLSSRVKELIDAIEAVQNQGGYLCGQSVMMVRQYLSTSSQSLEKQLTLREQEIVAHVKTGNSSKQIAALLHVSLPTVNFHLQNVYKKLDVSSRPALMAKLAS